MTLRNHPSLEQASLSGLRRAHVDYSMLMLLDDWSNDAWPVVRHLLRVLGLANVLSRQRTSLLCDQIAELFVDHIRLCWLLREHFVRYFLSQLTEMTPQVRVLGHGALAVVRTRCHDMRLLAALVNNPVAHSMNIPEALGTARLNDNEYASIAHSLPESIKYEHARLLTLDLLQHIAKDDYVELAALSTLTGNHGQRVSPQNVVVLCREVLADELAQLAHVNVRFDRSCTQYLVPVAVHGGPETRSQASAIIKNGQLVLWFKLLQLALGLQLEARHALLHLNDESLVDEVMVRHFPLQISHTVLTLIKQVVFLLLILVFFIMTTSTLTLGLSGIHKKARHVIFFSFDWLGCRKCCCLCLRLLFCTLLLDLLTSQIRENFGSHILEVGRV